MQHSMSNQSSWNETIRSDLKDIRSRLAIVETTIENIVKQGGNTTTGGHRIGRKLRSQHLFRQKRD